MTTIDRIRKAEAKYAYRLTYKDEKSVRRAASFIMQRDRETLRNANGAAVAEELLYNRVGESFLTQPLRLALKAEENSTRAWPVAVQVEKVIAAYYNDAMRELDRFLKSGRREPRASTMLNALKTIAAWDPAAARDEPEGMSITDVIDIASKAIGK
jgi:hypothetical protein